MIHPLVEYFRCPDHLAVLRTADALSPDPGYFKVGDAIGFGRAPVGSTSMEVDHRVVDVSPLVTARPGLVTLPFDLGEVTANLRHERYPEAQRAVQQVSASSLTRLVYYLLRPALPVVIRKHLQRLHWKGWRDIAFPRWPVDVSVESLMRTSAGLVLEHGGVREFPFIWFWPDGAPGCAMMTHDVEGPSGAAFCSQLMDLDDRFRIPSSFQVVPDAQWSSRGSTRRLVEALKARGFEVNVHDLSHDGRLFRERERFLRHAATINARGREFGSRGFRSGAMYHRQDWLAALDISYDMSVPNVAHLEPQRGGCCTVMPYFIGHVLEIPLTAAQDYTVFHVLGDYSLQLWQEQIDTILEANGLISFIAHPDYLREPRALEVYTELLGVLDGLRRDRGLWIAPPAAIDKWWRARREMTLVRDGASWRVRGAGSERARVAWARLDGKRVVYDVGPSRRAA
jgi:hypothetical protein